MNQSFVTSNALALPLTGRYTGRLEDTPRAALGDGSLPRRLASAGYLLLRDLLPRPQVLAMRALYFALYSAACLAEGDCAPDAACAASGRTAAGAHGAPGHPAHAFVRDPRFLDFVEQPRLRTVATTLLGAQPRRLRRTPVRCFDASHPVSSRAHFDATYLSAPRDAAVTFWIPLGDCPLETGGLTYLEGSHLDPAALEALRSRAPTDRPGDRRPLTHDLKWLADISGRRWLLTDYRAGDVVVHLPSIVHASLDVTTPEMRLSTDIRFVRLNDQPDPRWLADWSGDDGY